MKRILFDINVVLDVLLDRNPHAAASAGAWAAIESGKAEGLLAAHSVTTIYYLIRKETKAAESRRMMAAILKVFGGAPVDATAVREALQLPCPDFEDGVTAMAAGHAGCDYIVTRDPRGFRGSPVQSLTPEMLMPLLDGQAK